MDHGAPPAAPARRRRRTVLAGLAILGVALPAVALRPSLGATAPVRQWAEPGRAPAPTGALDESDGLVPDGVVVPVFDEDVPAVGNLDPDLLAALQRAATDARADGLGLGITSGWRSPRYQQQLLQDAVIEHGSPEEAARWVATPETSAHVSGDAADIGAMGPFDAAAWLAEHGAAHGLCPIYGNEPWHYELRPDAVEAGCPPMYADPTRDPRMQP